MWLIGVSKAYSGCHCDSIRNIIFRSSLEDVIGLFYYGNNANYREILRDVNQIRRLQIQIFREHNRDVPEGLQVVLPEDFPEDNFLLTHGARGRMHNKVPTIFWMS